MPRLAFLGLLLIVTTHAAASNDWTQPCFNHTCTYHLPENGPGRGSLTLWGPPGILSDITPAAGWEIVACEKNKLEQEIRVVCMDDASCAHLYEDGGPEGKVVRLPESCGQMAFALIKRSWVHDDQSIPQHIARRLSKRQQLPVVLGKRITHEIAGEATKDLQFEAIGTTSQAKKGSYTVSDGQKGSSAGNALNARRAIFVGESATSGKPRELLSDAADAFNGAATQAVGFLSRYLFKLDKQNLENITPIKLSFPETTIASLEVTCGKGVAKTELSAHADGNIVAMVGVHMRGSLNGSMERAEAYVQINGDVKGGVSLSANLNGHFGPYEASLFRHPLDALDFGRIFTVGPKLEVIGLVEADLNVKAEMKYDFEYDFNNLRLSFPPDQGRSDFASKTQESPLKLKVEQSVEASGKISAHVIPRLVVDFGLSSKLHASMFVAVDASVATGFHAGIQGVTAVGAKPIDPVSVTTTAINLIFANDEAKASMRRRLAENTPVYSRTHNKAFSERSVDRYEASGSSVRRETSSVPGAPVENLSLLKVVPSLTDTFGVISTEMTSKACVFAEPSLDVLAGVEADATIANIAELLGFEARFESTITLYSIDFEKFSLHGGDDKCPGSPSEKRSIESNISEPRLPMSIRRVEKQAPFCVVSASLTTKEELINAAIDGNAPGPVKPILKDFAQYTLAKKQEKVTADPKVVAGNTGLLNT